MSSQGRSDDDGGEEILEAYRTLKKSDPEAAELLVAVVRKLLRLQRVRK